MNRDQQNGTEGGTKLTFWQQNLGKSNMAQQDWLVTMGKRRVLIGLAQEPYIDFVGNSRANQTWSAIYPTTHWTKPERTRSYTVIHRLLPQDRWEQVKVESPDVTAVRIQDEQGDLYVFNIYNDQKHSDALHAVDRTIGIIRRSRRAANRPYYFMWAGDFNRHSPLWDEDRNYHLFTRPNLNMAQTLIDLTIKHGLAMALPSGIPTLCANGTKNFTRPDNVFISELLMDRCDSCTVEDHERPPKTDHMPIHIVLEYNLELKNIVPRHDWVKVDWDEYNKTLKDTLNNCPYPEEVQTMEEFDEVLATLDDAIEVATEKHVPVTNHHKIYSKRWWNKDLDAQ
jgi:hypothetical protein